MNKNSFMQILANIFVQSSDTGEGEVRVRDPHPRVQTFVSRLTNAALGYQSVGPVRGGKVVPERPPVQCQCRGQPGLWGVASAPDATPSLHRSEPQG